MKNFEFYKTVKISDELVRRRISSLHNIYKLIPETKGCLENIKKENGCGGWCCKFQTPQLLYCEFLLMWNYVSRKWSDYDVLDLIEKCMINSVDVSPSKGCVFFDSNSCLCKIHKVRPLNCRIYGITPPEEFNPRYEKLKEEYKSIIDAIIRPQCDLVSTVDGKKVEVSDTDLWWGKIKKVEKSLGIPYDMMTDDSDGGSYRSPFVHVLLYLMPENIISAMAGIRLYEKWEDKIFAIKNLMSSLRAFYEKEKKNG